MVSSEVLESSIQEIGQSLAKRSKDRVPGFFHYRRWTNLLLDWCTRDDQFRVQLFRFVDVLPTLKTDAQFMRMLKEYFGDLSIIPLPLRWLLRGASTTSISSHMGTLLLRRQFLKMAETFMAGRSIEDALPVLARLWKAGCGFSIDFLGEATVSEIEADQYCERCLQALRVLDQHTRHWPEQPILERDHLGPIPRIQLSVKVSALYSQLDPIDPEGSFAGVSTRLRKILDAAQTIPAAITFDMEQAELKDLTIQIFMRMFSEEPYRSYPYAGIALQTYLRDSEATLETLLNWTRQRGTPIHIRVVKGAYWDSETVHYAQRGWPVPVYLSKPETDANYEKLTQKILEHLDLIRPAFGTHNLRSLAHAEACAQHTNQPQGTCEYQMLFGMAESLRKAAIDSGLRMRVYTPVGELIPGMAYLVRRLLENTSNESFIRRQYEAPTSIEPLLTPPFPNNGQSQQRDEAQTKCEPPRLDEFRNEPHTDFSQPDSHTRMLEALTCVRKQLGLSPSYTLANEVTPSGPTLISVNPSNPDEIIARFSTVAPEDIDHIIKDALGKMSFWRTVPAKERAKLLFRTAELIRAQRSELAAWEIFETGKPWREADADVAEAIDFLEFYGRQMLRLGQLIRLGKEPGELNHLTYSPLGLAVVISPWNFSLAIPTGLVSAALVTGNIVLFKPSERSTTMGFHLLTLLKKAGVPGGVLHFLPGGPDIGRALVAHPEVHMIAFTGSKEVGLQILKQSSQILPGQRHVKHVIAEMGGKNAIIVDDTADLDEAVTGVLSSATGYQGQKCSACSRVIVHDSIYHSFIERLKQAALSITIGPPECPTNRMGPLIDERALLRVREYVELGTQGGTELLDRRIDSSGYFQGPVILTDVAPNHRVAQEEIFGPVMAIIRAKSFEQALQFANDSSYALTGGIYSRSPANIHLAREHFDVGNLYINRSITGSLVGRQPFGGHRLSGIGRKAGGDDYLRQFMVERVISENTLRRGFAPS